MPWSTATHTHTHTHTQSKWLVSIQYVLKFSYFSSQHCPIQTKAPLPRTLPQNPNTRPNPMISTSWHPILTTPPCVSSLSGQKPSCSVPGRFLDGSHWQVIGNPSVSISKLFPRLPLPVRSGILVRLCHDWGLRKSHYNYLCVPLIPGWRRQWHPTPVLLPGKSHGWRSLEGCSPWGCWGSDMTEWLHFDFSLSCIGEGNGNPLQCSCLENPRDGEAWWAAIYGVAQSRTRLKWLSSSSIFYT